ncbi:hypothetical protein [Diaminobutyricimonas sp. LJ205]|uniref:hypothetical protein n=1 Tax=Diaminobutyricimonas sp. LJ205 TaxID=2683590 RepID=UPI0012F4867E|nr:hypothetical protein [Diaminobutyricimonas sp. LJ205]
MLSEVDDDLFAPSGAYLRADAVAEFRMAQLLITIAAEFPSQQSLDLERLAIVEFLAANPFLVFDEDEELATRLRLAGFGTHSLSYAAPGQRYATRRERLFSDLNRLVAFGLVSLRVVGGRRVLDATPLGMTVAAEMTSTYADAFRSSLKVVGPVVARLSDAALRQQLGVWLRADPLLFDLLDLEHVSPPDDPAFLMAPWSEQ